MFGQFVPIFVRSASLPFILDFRGRRADYVLLLRKCVAFKYMYYKHMKVRMSSLKTGNRRVSYDMGKYGRGD